MPVDHEIINRDYIVVTAFGVVTGVELSDHVFTMVNLHGVSLNSGYKQTFDAMAVERMDFDESDMKHISQIVLNHGQNRGNVSIAFAATDSHVREMIIYYMKLCEAADLTTRLFDNRKEADDWLLST